MANDYQPNPIETGHIELDGDLSLLVERLAENAHDVWARQRIKDGWIHGPERCDASRQHPCLIAYDQLPDEEKTYDRNAVVETVRAILALGFIIGRGPGVDLPDKGTGVQA